VVEALRAGRPIQEILLASQTKPAKIIDEITDLAGRAGVRIREVTNREIDERSRTRAPQGVIAVVPPFDYSSLEKVLARLDDATGPALLVALDEVTDPQNFGAIARSAEAAGAHGVIIGRRRAAPVTAAVEKSAAGALAYLPVAQVPNLPRALEELKERRIWVVSLDGEATRTIYDLDVATEPLCVVVGSEGKGVSRLVRDRADLSVRIPMSGQVESLNASAATAIALFEIARQRR
jgi:23S rRNA (guanosine2251-2'-O)-methyltransferase